MASSPQTFWQISQKQIQAIDTRYHGIRLDARVDEEADGKVRATIYDIEMENRPADRAPLPRRLRFYDSIIDSRLLESGAGYDDLPDFVSIIILSYDPFGAGDMYYEASTTLTTHPDIGYDDGICTSSCIAMEKQVRPCLLRMENDSRKC